MTLQITKIMQSCESEVDGMAQKQCLGQGRGLGMSSVLVHFRAASGLRTTMTGRHSLHFIRGMRSRFEPKYLAPYPAFYIQ